MIFWQILVVKSIEADIEGVNAPWLFTFIHHNHVNLSESVPSFETHQVVMRFSHKNLHVIIVA